MTVSLRMFDRGDQVLNAQPCQKVFVSLSFELSVVVGDNGVWKAIPTDEVLPCKFFHLASRHFPKWSCFYPLGEVVDGNQQVLDNSWGLWQWSQYVHSPLGEGPREAQIVKVVRRSAWHICKLLTSSTSPRKVEGIHPSNQLAPLWWLGSVLRYRDCGSLPEVLS